MSLHHDLGRDATGKTLVIPTERPPAVVLSAALRFRPRDFA